jgi:hypothetical protein
MSENSFFDDVRRRKIDADHAALAHENNGLVGRRGRPHDGDHIGLQMGLRRRGVVIRDEPNGVQASDFDKAPVAFNCVRTERRPFVKAGLISHGRRREAREAERKGRQQTH